MEGTQEKSITPSTWQRGEESIRKILEDLNLYSHLPQRNGERTVAILGAGPAVEINPIHDLMFQGDNESPRIVAFDLDEAGKILTEQSLRNRHINLEYRIADITDEQSYRGEEYDLVVIRNPNIHVSESEWVKALNKAYDHLKKAGIILFTSREPHVQKFGEEKLVERGNMVVKHQTPWRTRGGYVGEDYAFVVRKKD